MSNINTNTRFPRRTLLRGVGAAMSLPLLDIMLPTRAQAAPNSTATPKRMAYVFFPNGAIMENWKPSGEGEDFEFSPTLKLLEKHRSDLTIFSGLTQHHGRANGDGAGDHARNAGSFLTGAQPRKTSGSDIKLGVSADQAAAQVIGKHTKLPSLELGIVRGRNAGNCDSGYSCAYSSNISWKSETTPMAKEINPKLAFERLFGSADAERGRAQRDLYRKSILDLVAEDAALLRRKLGKKDRQKVEEYFTSVRELELQIERAATRRAEVPEYDVPEGIPRETGDHIRLMYDIILLAFQTDSTRIASFMLGNAGSNRSYPMVGVKGGHHGLSHHRNDKQKMADITKIDQYLIGHFAAFLDRLKATPDGESNLLDNSMILYGSAIADGNRHSHDDLPILVAGSGGGTIKTGRYLKYDNNTPLNNLFLAMSHRVGANVESIGDSTGPLPRLDA